MKRLFRTSFVAILAFAAFAGIAAAEITIPVNDNNTGVFDQPSTALSGTTVHVAFIGDNTATGAFRVFYAAVNGAADFTNLQLPRDNTVLFVFPTVIDNTGAGGNSPYFDARHPKIALRTSTEAVILFQAKPAADNVVYRPYIARLDLSTTPPTLISVRRIEGFPTGILSTGDIEDISFGIVTTDNTVRMAFANKSAIGSASLFQVYFGRLVLDNAVVVGTPILLSSGDNNPVTGSDGFRPIPSLKVDGPARSHVAWAATDSSTTNPGAVYYALVKDVGGGVDNVAIGATEILGRTKRWGHPNLLISGNSSATVLAADESVPGIAGNIGLAQFNPDAVTQNGLPVQFGTASTFYSIRPTILSSSFDLFRPEAFLDTTGRVHLTGYGNTGSTATYYAITLSTAFPFANFLTLPIPVGINEFPGGIAGDYTKAAFGYISGKAVVFWSGIIPGSSPERRNLDVTTVPTVTDPPQPTQESGCSMVRSPHVGESGRIPGTALLFLPAIALFLRRISRSGGPLSTGVRRLRRRAIAGWCSVS
ncbi:MAG: hypothetical protein HZA60_07595 [Deltaproteobacteria bacterium]|nr:hypothetical protein [Deltaproteobacteria bacterium]